VITVLLNANVTQLQSSADGTSVERVAFADGDGRYNHVRAKIFMLAAGGIENARLLLLSCSTHAAGLGNQNDLVGRHFMEHPRIRMGRIYVNGSLHSARQYDSRHLMPKPFRLTARRPGSYFELAPQIQKSERLLRCSFGLLATYCSEDEPATRRAKEIYWGLLNHGAPSISKPDFVQLACGAPKIAAAFVGRMTRARALLRYHTIEAVLEPRPDPHNRVTLSQERDRFGLHKAHLVWRIGELERLTHKRTLEIFGEQTGIGGFGTLSVDQAAWDERWFANILPTWHHLGTTRMGRTPQQGVVDRDCRVFGIRNLFVAGSSVFPTATGCAPTFTIVALALRLADHIGHVRTSLH
jgi:choline dehydrogenase-like flavoprotein